jgi:hypothetical protein
MTIPYLIARKNIHFGELTMEFGKRVVPATAMAAVLIVALTTSMSAQISITSPLDGSTKAMPIWLRANVSECNGNSNMTLFGYSIDSSPFITPGKSNNTIDSIDYRLSSPGTYLIHFKAWSQSGECTTADSTVTVTGPTTTSDSAVLADSNWKWTFDTGTTGSASGTTTYPVASPAQDSQSRQFSMSYTNGGGMRGSTAYANDINATHFIYDTYVYLTNPANVQNIEMDTNQVWNQNGDVMILGLQCAGGSKTWEFTTNVSAKTHWNPSNVPCNPQTWSANTWHHVQLITHTDGTGNVFYDSVILDGLKSDFSNAYGNSSYSLRWSPTGELILNFQLDGKGASGSITAYADGMTMIRW